MREDNRSLEIPPARRRQEVAAILATGVLRYRRMARKTSTAGGIAACSAPQESADSQRL